MPTNVFRTLSAEGGLFRDESVLRPEHMPDELPGRERQMREIAAFLQEAARGRAPPSILLVGPPGVGKTSTMKLLLRQLAEVSRKPLPVYINCWETSTRFGILNALVIALGDMMPRRGIASDEVVARLREIGRRQEQIPVVVLDEMDRLLAAPSHEEEVLYDLSRAGEALGLKAGMVGITNDEEIALHLEGRVRSSLTNHMVHFPPYNPTELKEILRERSRLAFFPGALDEDALGLCAAVGVKAGGDARVSLHLMWAAGKKADAAGARQVLIEHVKAAREGALAIAATPAARKKADLDKIDLKLVELIGKAGAGGVDSGKVYAAFRADEGEQRALRNRLLRLEKGGLIDGEDAGGGRTRVWKLKRTA